VLLPPPVEAGALHPRHHPQVEEGEAASNGVLTRTRVMGILLVSRLSLFSHLNVLTYSLSRTSENSVSAKFAEFTFYEVG
jgi:hypothetical protein